MVSQKVGKHPLSSFPRKRESSKINQFWTPAFAGVTALETFYEFIKIEELEKRSRHLMKTAVMIVILGAFLFGGCAEKEYRSSKIRIQHPKWDDSTIRKVAKREVEPGMTSEMVRAALGIPDAISRQGDQERWGYGIQVGDYQPREKLVFFVYFKYGVVTKTAGDRNKLRTFSWYQ